MRRDGTNPGVIERWARERLAAADGDVAYLTEVLTTVGALGYRDLWREVAGLLTHPDEDVVTAALDVLADWEEVRAYPEILSLWEGRRRLAGSCSRSLRAAVWSLTGERIRSPREFRAWLG